VRVATVSAVALTTVGAILDYGGLGDLLIDGTLTNFKAQVLATSVLCVLLAVTLDVILVVVQRMLTPWTRTARAR
jgi:osmoprotectant transport system permease protein